MDPQPKPSGRAASDRKPPPGQGDGPSSEAQVVQIDEESLRELNRVEMSIIQWNGRYMGLALDMRGIESTVHTLQQHKTEVMKKALEKLGLNIESFEIAQVSPGGQAVLIPKRDGRPVRTAQSGEPPPTEAGPA